MLPSTTAATHARREDLRRPMWCDGAIIQKAKTTPPGVDDGPALRAGRRTGGDAADAPLARVGAAEAGQATRPRRPTRTPLRGNLVGLLRPAPSTTRSRRRDLVAFGAPIHAHALVRVNVCPPSPHRARRRGQTHLPSRP